MINRDQASSLYEQHYRYALSFARKLCEDNDLAKHVVSDVFSRVVERAETITNVKGYILRSVHHRLVDYYRDAKRDAPIENALHITEGNDFRPVEVAVEDKEFRRENGSLTARVFAAMKERLNHQERRILVLRYIQERSQVETAEAMGLSVNSVKVIRHRSIVKLRRVLDASAESRPEQPLDIPQPEPLEPEPLNTETRSCPGTFIGEAQEPYLQIVPARKKIEVAKAMQRFMSEYGKTLDETARFFGVRPGTVTQTKCLLKLSERDQQRLTSGEIDLATARAILAERSTVKK